jgi:hypothetical protein
MPSLHVFDPGEHSKSLPFEHIYYFVYLWKLLQLIYLGEVIRSFSSNRIFALSENPSFFSKRRKAMRHHREARSRQVEKYLRFPGFWPRHFHKEQNQR